MADNVTIQQEEHNPTVEEQAAQMEEEVKAQNEEAEGNTKKFADKYESPEALEKAYKELEAEYTKSRQELSELTKSKEESTEDEKDAEKKEEDSTDKTDDEIKEALESKGIDPTEFATEYAEKGELSEGSYEKLAKAGFDEDFVNDVLAGREALVRESARRAIQSAGMSGHEEYEQVLAWAKTALAPEQIKAYDTAVAGNNEAEIVMAMKGLYMDFINENGSSPKFVSGSKGSNGPTDAFESTYEMTKAMGDPRYDKDPAYRQKVDEKVGRSKFPYKQL